MRGGRLAQLIVSTRIGKIVASCVGFGAAFFTHDVQVFYQQAILQLMLLIIIFKISSFV